ncbi:MAG TPA: acylneuraminate cytidylyltransferase family protein [Tepidisphaeraceae bacterium]|jgi:CMP-N-acetylneuraminic acid synthetase|nr:acylneuraminate cytidylyltransferase family protein [Tepidisphaeraceae bacterium]
MNTLAVILARAGSEGLANKHLRLICGRPVVEYTFDHAAESKLLGKTVVSTDCQRVKELARARGLPVIDRPAELATSSASVQDAMLHAMDVVESQGNFHAEALVVLYGNVPIRQGGIIDEALHLLRKTGCDSVRSFCPVGKWHPAWMSRLAGDRVEPFIPGSIHRRQDLAPLYLHDGAVVAVSREAMLRGREHRNDPHAFFGIDRRAVVTGVGQTVEIDHARDLLLAEAMVKEATFPKARVA